MFWFTVLSSYLEEVSAALIKAESL